MEVCPYLEAIQKLAGLTAGEKFKTINKIAQTIAAKGQGATIEIHSSAELPEILIPLVKVEIAKILRQPEAIVEALTNSDSFIFERALKAKWFFDGSNKNLTNVTYFSTKIFPFISVNRRRKLIKVLATTLGVNNSAIVEEFYLTMSQIYEDKELTPLLLHCSELFIWKIIIERRLILSSRSLIFIFLKYPKLVINYFKLNKINDPPFTRNIHKISMHYYEEMLPRLLKNHFNDFVEIIELHHLVYRRLTPSATLIFLKKGIDALMRNPRFFIPRLEMSIVISKLNEQQLRKILFELLPESLRNFFFDDYLDILEYYRPEKDRMFVFLSVFEERYHIKFTDCINLVLPQALRRLPQEQRVTVARQKMKIDDEINPCSIEEAWRCYLTIDESISLIKKMITITSNSSQRMDLLEQLIYTCRVNDDYNALLDVLKYITTRHQNEQSLGLLKVLQRLLNDFKLEEITLDHWNVLNNLLQIMHGKDELRNRIGTVKELFSIGIYLNLINNLPVDNEINILVDIIGNNLNHWNCTWNLLEDHPIFERKCLVEMINLIPIKFSKATDIRQLYWRETVESIMTAIYSFNKRNSKAKQKLEMLSVKNYLWLAESIQQYLNQMDSCYATIKITLKNNEPKLYKSWYVNNDNEISNVNSMEAIVLLKKNPQIIIKNWIKYYEKCKDHITSNYVYRFIKLSRWYQDLGINFAKKALKDLAKSQDGSEFIILALLLDGSTFERIILPYTPTVLTINFHDKDAKKNYAIQQSIVKSFNIINPVVSLKQVEHYYEGDYSKLAINYILSFGRRYSVDKIVPFARDLIEQRVSIKKQAIRLFCENGNNDQIKEILVTLWHTEKHRSIRCLVNNLIRRMFVTRPGPDTWAIFCECFDSLSTDDNDIIDGLINFDGILNEYIEDYVKKCFATYNRLGKIENGLSTAVVTSYICRLITAINEVAFLFTEDYHKEILKTYFADLTLPIELLNVARRYLVYSYIKSAGEKLETRLQYYSYILCDILIQNWNVPHPNEPAYYPANYMMHTATDFIMLFNMEEHEIEKARLIETTLQVFNLVLTPQQAPVFYLNFTFVVSFMRSESSDYFAIIVDILPRLIDIYTEEFIDIIAKSLITSLDILVYESQMNTVALDIIEQLMNGLNINKIKLAAALFANGFIDSAYKSHEQRFLNVIKKLLNCNVPSAILNVNMHINERKPQVDK